MRYSLPVIFSLSMLICGCFPPPQQGPAVQRINANTQVDLSGNWNDTDANQVAQVMLRDCLSRPWAANFRQKKGKNPVIKLYPIRNRSSEHINTKFFTKQVEMEIVNSGTVGVVAAFDETAATRYERRDQGHHASDLTKKENQNETGADYVLNGWVVAQNDRIGGQEVRAYLVTMELTDIETQQKVWMKVHRLKKVINRPASTW